MLDPTRPKSTGGFAGSQTLHASGAKAKPNHPTPTNRARKPKNHLGEILLELTMHCPFCLPQLNNETIILENNLCLFIQQPEKVLIGSGFIIPKEHRETVFDLTEEEWMATFGLLRKVKSFVDEKYSPAGYNVGWNVGKVGGQEVFHVHLHVIPRFVDEPYAGRGIRYWLKQDTNKRPQ